MSVHSQTIGFDTAAEDEPSKVCYEGLTNTTTRLGVLLHSQAFLYFFGFSLKAFRPENVFTVADFDMYRRKPMVTEE